MKHLWWHDHEPGESGAADHTCPTDTRSHHRRCQLSVLALGWHALQYHLSSDSWGLLWIKIPNCSQNVLQFRTSPLNLGMLSLGNLMLVAPFGLEKPEWSESVDQVSSSFIKPVTFLCLLIIPFRVTFSFYGTLSKSIASGNGLPSCHSGINSWMITSKSAWSLMTCSNRHSKTPESTVSTFIWSTPSSMMRVREVINSRRELYAPI